MIGFTPEQKLLAARARARARHFVSHTVLPIVGGEGDEEELIGGSSGPRAADSGVRGGHAERLKYTQMREDERAGVERCLRCTGLGYLTCMACTD
jgi:hypothetical protein